VAGVGDLLAQEDAEVDHQWGVMQDEELGETPCASVRKAPLQPEYGRAQRA
jgi:hypothetical protein